MEALLTLVALALIAWVLVGPFLALAALRRAKEAEAKLMKLRRWVEHLDRGEHLLPREGDDAPRETAPPPAPVPQPEPALPFRDEFEAEAPKESPVPPPPVPAPFIEPKPPTAPAYRVPPPAPREPRRPIEWERWVGVRGAALLGGVLFALAAVFLYLHAVEQQWITPRSRVFSGSGAGLVLVAVAEYLRRKRFRFAPGACAAAGIVALYASTWAAHGLYAMIGQVPALAAFAAITALCVGMALRHESQFVAVLGLLGGFATPLVLQMPAGNPIGFFGYLLLLDAGLLMVGKRKSWSSLGLLGILATGALETYWVLVHASPDEALVGLGALTAIALVFVSSKPALDRVEPIIAHVTRGLVVLTPLALGMVFARRGGIGLELWVLATYASILALAGLVLARRQGNPTLAIASALALVAVVLAWSGGRLIEGRDAVELCAVSIGAVLLFTVVGRVDGTTTGRSCALSVQSGMLVLLAGLALHPGYRLDDSPWPWFGASALAIVAVLEHRSLGWWRLLPSLAGGALAAVALYLRTDPLGAFAPPPGVRLAAALTFGVALASAGFFGARGGDRQRPFVAALAIAPLLVLFETTLLSMPGGWYVATMGALALCVAVLATRAQSGLLLQAASALAVVAIPVHDLLGGITQAGFDKTSEWTLLAVVATTVTLSAWPALFRGRFASSTAAWRAAASTPALLYTSMIEVLAPHFGRSWKLLAPAFVAALLLAVDALGARRLDPELRSSRQVPVRRVARTWLRGTAAPFVAAAMVMWAGGNWGILWMAISGALLALVARAEQHPGPAVVGSLAFCGAICALVIAGFERWYEVSERFLPGRMTLDAWGAAACAGAALWCSTRPDRAHLAQSRPWLQRLTTPISVVAALALAVCLFQWINLTVFDHWTETARVAIRFDHLPARDLTLSSSWILYGLAWLGVGMWKRLSAARWLSLAVLLLSLAKVFLFDLAHLEGLYRVASLLGLGLSLVAVSLLYQRFVFHERA
ncbi:MAG: DUF2339 domain-containing protein [Planctomycetes bacterium]|nr:DUF2339 domain-containing protein [Planctomycetota bacterium]MCB9904962.1 DUF2339 domain-containing protein [Planctomycetota bacterium]